MNLRFKKLKLENKLRCIKIIIIFMISMVDLVGINVRIAIIIMVKFQTLNAFNATSVQL